MAERPGPNPRKSLSDLYTLGKPFRYEDGRRVITVWLEVLDPLDHDTAVRKAKAARARMRATLNDHDSDEYMLLVDAVDMTPREKLVETISAEDEAKLVDSVRSEMMLGDDSEWSKDDYFDALMDEWNDRVRDQYDADPDDADAARILAEFQRFDNEFGEILKPQIADLRAQYEGMTDVQVREKALEVLVVRQIGQAWVEEFTRSEIWLATRQPCARCDVELDAEAAGTPVPADQRHQERHRDYHFANRDEVDRLKDPVRKAIESAYITLAMDPSEGKDLRAIGDSSDSSASPAPEETDGSSIPLAATA